MIKNSRMCLVILVILMMTVIVFLFGFVETNISSLFYFVLWMFCLSVMNYLIKMA